MSDRHILRLSDLSARAATSFDLAPDAATRAELAEALGISAIRKLTFAGALTPQGGRDWRLEARLGATVVQPCVVTLEPVATRIDEDVLRLFLAEAPAEDLAGEVEMPDDAVESLPESLDLTEVMTEALALALPAYPRAPGAAPAASAFTEPGKAPMTDDDAKPFAALQALRDKLGKDN